MMTMGDHFFEPKVSLKEVFDRYEQCYVDYFMASPALEKFGFVFPVGCFMNE